MLSVKINKLYKILLFITCINTPVNSYGLWNWDNNFHYSDLQAYIGIAIGYNNYRMGSGFNHIRYDSNVIKKGRLFNQQTNNASVFINFRNNKYFGFELGHSFFNREKNSFISTVNNNKYLILFRMLNSYLDAHSYWPLSSNFDLIAALGIGRIRTDIQLLGNGHLNVATLKLPATLIGTRNKLGIRIGFGLQYKWRSNFFTKLTYCRQTGNKITRTLNLLQLSGAIKI